LRQERRKSLNPATGRDNSIKKTLKAAAISNGNLSQLKESEAPGCDAALLSAAGLVL
jgi:hypothetical protein